MRVFTQSRWAFKCGPDPLGVGHLRSMRQSKPWLGHVCSNKFGTGGKWRFFENYKIMYYEYQIKVPRNLNISM